LILTSCSEQDIYEDKAISSLIIMDSIVYEPENTYSSYYNFDLWSKGFFIIASADKQIYVLDRKGKIKYKIGKVGRSAEEYSDRIAGIRALSLDSIFVADALENKVLLFNSKSEMLKYWKPNLKDTLNSFYLHPSYLNVKIKNEDFIFEYMGDAGKYVLGSTKEYYQYSKILSVWSESTDKVENYIPYPQESPYREQRLIGPLQPVVEQLPISENYVVIYPEDDAVYLHDANTKELLHRIDGKGAFFPKKQKGVPFGTRITEIDIVEVHLKQNAENILSASANVFVSKGKEYLVKQYSKPYNIDTKNISVFYDMMNENRQTYLQIFDLSTMKKIGKDIIVPKQLYALVGVVDNGTMIFTSNNLNKNSNEEINKLYLCKADIDL
jgi:hypothetical protein